MPRIDFVDENDCGAPETVAAIRARRRGGQLIALDRMLLHAPPFAAGWSALLKAVRGELTLPARLRELAICTIAVLNGAEYEFAQHAPEFLAAGGTEAELAALRGIDAGIPASFGETDSAVLGVTLEMTRQVAVTDETFAAARRLLGNDRLMVELVGTIATYNMVSRFLAALEIEPD
jgi:alkylhydroperoxidase family enzyme